jgi:hypothetical protein
MDVVPYPLFPYLRATRTTGTHDCFSMTREGTVVHRRRQLTRPNVRVGSNLRRGGTIKSRQLFPKHRTCLLAPTTAGLCQKATYAHFDADIIFVGVQMQSCPEHASIFDA